MKKEILDEDMAILLDIPISTYCGTRGWKAEKNPRNSLYEFFSKLKEEEARETVERLDYYKKIGKDEKTEIKKSISFETTTPYRTLDDWSKESSVRHSTFVFLVVYFAFYRAEVLA